jgi:predicted transcriptional regulator of viral defense system
VPSRHAEHPDAEERHRQALCERLRKFFGFKSYNVYGRSTRISDLEKTLLDCIDRPDLAGGPTELTRIVHAAMAEIDQEKLVAAAIKMNSNRCCSALDF